MDSERDALAVDEIITDWHLRSADRYSYVESCRPYLEGLTDDERVAIVGLFESTQETMKRFEVLRKINTLVKQWVREITLTKVCLCFEL